MSLLKNLKSIILTFGIDNYMKKNDLQKIYVHNLDDHLKFKEDEFRVGIGNQALTIRFMYNARVESYNSQWSKVRSKTQNCIGSDQNSLISVLAVLNFIY